MGPVSLTGEVASSFGASGDLDLGHWYFGPSPGRMIGETGLGKEKPMRACFTLRGEQPFVRDV